MNRFEALGLTVEQTRVPWDLRPSFWTDAGCLKNLRVGGSDIRSTSVKISKEPNNDEIRCAFHFKRSGLTWPTAARVRDERSGLLFLRRTLIGPGEPAWVTPGTSGGW